MATKKKTAAKKPKEMLLVQSKVKDYVRQAGFMCSSDLIEQLNEQVAVMLDKAAERAEANGRKTARASDV
jgi:histone H3/H4